jgi:tetratricopeptide (TPR) repeat protein
LRSRLGQPGKARPHYLEALRLNPDHALAHFGFAALLDTQGEPAAAVSHYKDGLKTQPENKVAANNLAWLLATHHRDEIRDPAEALRIALELNAASGDKVPNILDTLSAAQAASGDFEAAAKTAQRAIVITKAAGDDVFVTVMTKRLTLYQAGKPYIDESVQAEE